MTTLPPPQTTRSAPAESWAMTSTTVPATTRHRDGTATEGTVQVVHAPGVPVVGRWDGPCLSDRCWCARPAYVPPKPPAGFR
jgi:hypothetical protein